MDIFPRINWLYNLGKNLKITFSREFFKKIDKLDEITKSQKKYYLLTNVQLQLDIFYCELSNVFSIKVMKKIHPILHETSYNTDI